MSAPKGCHQVDLGLDLASETWRVRTGYLVDSEYKPSTQIASLGSIYGSIRRCTIFIPCSKCPKMDTPNIPKPYQTIGFLLVFLANFGRFWTILGLSPWLWKAAPPAELRARSPSFPSSVRLDGSESLETQARSFSSFEVVSDINTDIRK